MLVAPNVQIPTNLRQCPLIDAVVEVRFEDPKIPGDAVLGMTYAAFKSEYSEPDVLPLGQVPAAVRDSELSLRYLPLHKMSRPGFSISVGPRVVLISATSPYPGWSAFHSVVKNALNSIQAVDIFGKPIRLGVRYINFFTFDVMPLLEISLNRPGHFEPATTTNFRVTELIESFRANLFVSNSVAMGEKFGSIIDIDIELKDHLPEGDLSSLSGGTLDAAHLLEKRVFFSTITPALLAKLEPEDKS